MNRDWGTLYRLRECGEEATALEKVLAELENRWETTVAGRSVGPVPPEILDDFFALWLPAISSLLDHGLVEDPWWSRLCDYFDARREFRENFRPFIYNRATREELKRFKAIFDVWDLCVTDEGRDSSVGRYFQSYRLELEARLAPIWHYQEQLFGEAARICLDPPVSAGDPRHEALRRRGLVLESHALRVAAFSLLNTNPADLRPVEEKFRRALDRADQARRVWYEPTDTHPSYLGFWAEATLLRRAEVEGDLATARSAHAAAEKHLNALAEPESLFKEPNLWWSVADFRREQSVIDVLEALAEGPEGLSRAIALLSRWLEESRTELATTIRLIRMDVRLEALKLLSGMHSGVDVSRRLPGLFEVLGRYPAIGRHTWEIANQAETAVRGRVSLLEAVSAVARLFPIDTQGPSGAAATSKGRWYLLPHWYETTFNRYRIQREVGAGRLVLLWYGRTVADYTWEVYVKNLAEEGGRPQGPNPDFMVASLSEIQQALSGLARALCWSGAPGRALQSLVDLLDEAAKAPLQNIASEILPSVIEETAYHLYPMPLRIDGEDPLDANTLIATRFNSGQRELRLTAASEQPGRGTYVYIKPRFKQSEGVLKQDKPLNLYPASSFAVPRPVVMICEGVTDQAVLEGVLDELDPSWRELEIKILPAEGDTLPSRFFALKSERPVVMADADKRYALKGGHWKRMWEACCYGFILDPDLERLSWDALRAALSAYWGCEVRTEDLRDISARTKSGKEFEKQVSTHYSQVDFKSRGFGLCLARETIRLGIPSTLQEIALYLVQLANGRQLACRKDVATPFHHCVT